MTSHSTEFPFGIEVIKGEKVIGPKGYYTVPPLTTQKGSEISDLFNKIQQEYTKKKEKNNMTNYTQEQEIELHFHVMNAIGLSIENGGRVINQSTRAPLMFEGKPLVYSFDINKPVFDTADTTKLDLINNTKMVTNIFGYYLECSKADEDNDMMDVYAFYQLENSDGATALEIKWKSEMEGDIITTGEYFYNNTLKFLSLMLKLEGVFIDIHIYDDPDLRKRGKK